MINKPSELTGWAFLKDFVELLEALEDRFDNQAHTVSGFVFTRHQVNVLITALYQTLHIKGEIEHLRLTVDRIEHGGKED